MVCRLLAAATHVHATHCMCRAIPAVQHPKPKTQNAYKNNLYPCNLIYYDFCETSVTSIDC